MRIGRRRDALPEALAPAWWAFLDCAEVIEGGRRVLLASLPTFRVEPVPIAVGTEAMRTALTDARAWMDAWRLDELADEWWAAAASLDEARAALDEVERLAATSDELDHVLGAVMGVIDPLDAFADAEAAFRRRWRCPEERPSLAPTDAAAADAAAAALPRTPALTYADAGVDLDAAEASVPLIGAVVARTHGPEVLGGVGGFGGLFRFDAAAWRDPVLVSSSDGVGTKVELARRLDVLDTVGIDLVAMVVDDLVACGATPLFLHDYLAVGRLDPERVATIVAGVAAGCEVAGCALVGGETAEHPGLLAADAFDLAGFAVGVVEREALLGPMRVRVGDALVGLPSSGLHANGFSLVRRIVEGLDLAEHHGFDRPLGQVLLEPTRIHAPDVLALTAGLDVHAACHVTGGGLPGNLPRVLPGGTAAEVDPDAWVRPEVFGWLARTGPVAPEAMWRTFNCGVGMVAVVAAEDADDAVAILRHRGVDATVIGRVVAQPAGAVHRVLTPAGEPLGARW